MMLSKLKLFAFALFVACTSSFALVDTISVDVGIAVSNTMPIGLVPFDQEADFEAISSKPDLSGRFSVVESPTFKMVTFVRAGAKFYVTGKLQKAEGSKVKLSCYLYATQTKDLILGEAYKVAQKDVRAALHDFVDKVVKQLWGEFGIASTELAWVSKSYKGSLRDEVKLK